MGGTASGLPAIRHKSHKTKQAADKLKAITPAVALTGALERALLS